MRNYLLIGLIALFNVLANAQVNGLPKNYFGPPVDIPMYLAGNFAELRNNHFHAGIDIKTQGVEGKNILASAGGYVSRIKIQHGGYGKVIYIDHPNGYTTVYAHLKSFSSKIDQFVKKEQYHNQSYTIDFYPDSNAIPVSKGEIIALSGNTGGSGGPHLHFEIRETASEHALNVLLSDLAIQDNIKPIVHHLRIYPLEDQGNVNGKPEAANLITQGSNGQYKVVSPPVIQGRFGLGINTIDKLNGSNNSCGVYSIKLYADDQLIFEQNTDRVPFDESRFINAHTDYAYKKQHNGWIHKSYIEPGNQLSIYKSSIGDGTIPYLKDSIIDFKYEIADAAGNVSEVHFKVIHKSPALSPIASLSDHFKQKMPYYKENQFFNHQILVTIPEGALYNDLNYEYYNAPHEKERWSDIHFVHNDLTPIHKNLEIILKCWPSPLIPTNKLVAIRKGSTGRMDCLTGTYTDGYFSFESRYFGAFYIFHDTIAPTVKPYDIYNGKNISNQSSFSFTISDNLSGIQDYNCYIDGKWILMEYDYKKAKITHYKDNQFSKGPHQLELVVKDVVGNTNVYKCLFNN